LWGFAHVGRGRENRRPGRLRVQEV
jgi:hypothetical protein